MLSFVTRKKTIPKIKIGFGILLPYSSHLKSFRLHSTFSCICVAPQEDTLKTKHVVQHTDI